MPKFYQNLLGIVLVVLFFVGIAFFGEISRRFPLLTISLLLILLILGFLFYKVPDSFGNNSQYRTAQIMFFLSFGIAILVFFDYSREKAYLEKKFFGGKVVHESVEIDADEGPGSAEVYENFKVSSMVDNSISFALLLLIVGIPCANYYMWQHPAKKKE